MARRGKKRPRPSQDQMLRSVPFPNEALKTYRRPEGFIVEVPMKKPGYLVPPISWVLPFSGVRRVELDEIGEVVLGLCDGVRSAEDIIEIFAQDHKLSFREAQIPVAQFLQLLSERGLIAMVGYQDDDTDGR